jgi:hypothetical protein
VHPRTAYCWTTVVTLLLSACWLTGCVQPSDVSGTTTLSKPWMFGIERMQGDPEPLLPYTNRFINDLAAMPRTQVVFVGTDRNRSAFTAWSGDKLLVAPWLHGEGNCMTVTYTIFQSGQQQAAFGQVVAALPAGTEPDPDCVDRAAAQFYRTLAIQGL